MIMDKELIFSAGQVFTATAASTNVVDLGLGDLGNSPMEVYVEMDAIIVRAAGACSMTVAVETDTVENFASPTAIASATYAKAATAAGTTLLKVKVPVGCERYIRIYYTFDNAPDSGTITAGLLQGNARQTNDGRLDIV